MPYPQHNKVNNDNDDVPREMAKVKNEDPKNANTNVKDEESPIEEVSLIVKNTDTSEVQQENPN